MEATLVIVVNIVMSLLAAGTIVVGAAVACRVSDYPMGKGSRPDWGGSSTHAAASSIPPTIPGGCQAVCNPSRSFVQSFALALRNDLKGTASR